jgi:PST family polysaccharide transporter
VWQQAAGTALGAAALIAMAGPPPAPRPRAAELRALLAVGLPLAGSTLAQIACYRVFAVAVGLTAEPAALGQVHMAFRLVETARDLAFSALWRVMLPDLSRRQGDRGTLLGRVDALLRRVAWPAAFGCAALAAGARWLLGEAWAQAGAAAPPLALPVLALALMFPGGVAAVALGRAAIALRANLLGLGACTAAVWLSRPQTAAAAAMAWIAAQAAVAAVARGRPGRRPRMRGDRRGLAALIQIGTAAPTVIGSAAPIRQADARTARAEAVRASRRPGWRRVSSAAGSTATATRANAATAPSS